MKPLNPEIKAEKIRKGVFRNLTLKVFIVSCMFLGSLVIFAFIVHEAVLENEQAFDNKVFSFFDALPTGKVVGAMKLFTFFGSGQFLFPAYVLLIVYFLLQKKYRCSLHIFITALSSTGLIFALKDLTHRHRPQLPIIQGITNYSFPSGHSLSTFIFCGIFTYIIWHGQMRTAYKWVLSALLFCFTMTVGISRIVLKVHYPTDVIGSFCLGTAWAIASLWILRRISKKERVTIND